MNGLLIIDKGEGWTSHDVVAKLRGLLKEKRVGHGGTLDPMATGVLPVFLGRATRAVEFCEDFDKEYIAGLRLGLVTDTQDTTGNVLQTAPVRTTRRELEEALVRFTGEQEQIPPMYSAIKIGGKKLYELARRGQEIAREPRHITLSAIELIETSPTEGCTDPVGEAILRVVCSKGTYIRTLCHDIGQALGCGGAMFSLRRTRVGPFSLSVNGGAPGKGAIAIDDVEGFSRDGRLQELIRPVDSLFAAYPAVTADETQKAKLLNGADFRVDNVCASGTGAGGPDGLCRVYDRNGNFLMLGRLDQGVMHTVKSFFDV
jgi:tRNA pseudouridine55 synthase